MRIDESRAASDAERASAFVVERVRRAAGARWRQGAWRPPLEARPVGEAVRIVAEVRLRRVERPAAAALAAWSRGARDVVLLEDVPTPRALLAMQARGRRCVSLLPDGADTGRHEDTLAFCLHDLCHLEKLHDPEHHVAQVGFFAALDRAMDGAAWRGLEARLDDAAWRVDRDYVAADMNGSPVFLFAALKMKLKMAVRRALAREDGREPPRGGPLDPQETRAFEAALAELCDALALAGPVRDAAFSVSTKHDAAESALRLVAAFEGLGRDALA